MDKFLRKSLMDRKIVQHLILKKSFNQIAKELKVGKKRIRTVNDLAEKLGYFDNIPLPSYPEPIFDYKKNCSPTLISAPDSILQDNMDWILERKTAGWHLITIWEELPVKVSKPSFYRFMRRHGLNIREEKYRCRVSISPEIINEPGETLYLDWGKLTDFIDPITGKKKTVWAFIGVMGFSRYLTVRLVLDNKTETTISSLKSIFNELGGVPRKITSDNPKCFTIEASKFEPLLNPAFERFCDHYSVVPEMLPPREPKKKGKVERAVPYVRRLYEAHGNNWAGIDEAQQYMNKKIAIANERKHGTIKLRPIDVFLDKEASFLKKLPNTSYQLEEYHIGKVRKDDYVRFRNKYYSVSSDYRKEEVFIIGNNEIVQIYHKGKLIETHNRITSNYKSKSTKDKHLKPWHRLMKDHKYLLKKGEEFGSNVRNAIEIILFRGNGFLDYRNIWGILSLDKSYSISEIDKACQSAIECDNVGYRAIKSFLELNTEDKTMKIKLSNNKFIRDPSEYIEQLIH